MAIKDIIGEGIGFAPQSIKFLILEGFGIGVPQGGGGGRGKRKRDKTWEQIRQQEAEHRRSHMLAANRIAEAQNALAHAAHLQNEMDDEAAFALILELV